MTKYRKKPVEVEAWQVGTEPIPEWIEFVVWPFKHGGRDVMGLYPLGASERRVVEVGKWAVYEMGRMQVYTPEQFEQAYEPISKEDA